MILSIIYNNIINLKGRFFQVFSQIFNKFLVESAWDDQTSLSYASVILLYYDSISTYERRYLPGASRVTDSLFDQYLCDFSWSFNVCGALDCTCPNVLMDYSSTGSLVTNFNGRCLLQPDLRRCFLFPSLGI